MFKCICFFRDEVIKIKFIILVRNCLNLVVTNKLCDYSEWNDGKQKRDR